MASTAGQVNGWLPVWAAQTPETCGVASSNLDHWFNHYYRFTLPFRIHKNVRPPKKLKVDFQVYIVDMNVAKPGNVGGRRHIRSITIYHNLN